VQAAHGRSGEVSLSLEEGCPLPADHSRMEAMLFLHTTEALCCSHSHTRPQVHTLTHTRKPPPHLCAD
jgi:hypothetical protein